MSASTYESNRPGTRNCGEWGREKQRTHFFDDITDLLDQKLFYHWSFYFVNHTFPHCLRQLGFLLLASKIILIDTCGLQTGFDTGWLRSLIIALALLFSVCLLCSLIGAVLVVLVRVL